MGNWCPDWQASLKLPASLPLKIGWAPKKTASSIPTIHFQVLFLAVSRRVSASLKLSASELTNLNIPIKTNMFILGGQLGDALLVSPKLPVSMSHEKTTWHGGGFSIKYPSEYHSSYEQWCSYWLVSPLVMWQAKEERMENLEWHIRSCVVYASVCILIGCGRCCCCCCCRSLQMAPCLLPLNIPSIHVHSHIIWARHFLSQCESQGRFVYDVGILAQMPLLQEIVNLK